MGKQGSRWRYADQMITLGIGKTIFRRREEPSEAIPQVISPAIRQALSEVISWCCFQSIVADQLRTPDLDPSPVLDIPSFDELGIEAWVLVKRESYRRAVDAINQTRSALLRDRNITISNTTVWQSKGKILLYQPLETVTCGAAEAISRGFFDIRDAPPWDTWFLYSEGAIFSWVPESLIQNAQAGIDANPVDCIHWIKWSELSH